jgi:hypothetical protein
MFGKFMAKLAAGAAKRHFVVKSIVAGAALACLMAGQAKAAVVVRADGPHVYGGNFATSGSFYISYDYEWENNAPVRRMRVFQSGKLGLINAPIESITWSPLTDEASMLGRFEAKGIQYTLKADFVLIKGIRAAQFSVYDKNFKLVGQSTAMRATVFSFAK